MLTVWDIDELDFLLGAAKPMPSKSVTTGIKNVGQRHLEHRFHLLPVDREGKTRTDPSYDRRDAKAADHHMIGQIANNGHKAGVKPNLLTRLAQRRGSRIWICRLDRSTWETDLTGMMTQALPAYRQQDRRRPGMINDGDQNRRGCRVGGKVAQQLTATLESLPGNPPVLAIMARPTAGKLCLDPGKRERTGAQHRGTGGRVNHRHLHRR